MNRSRLAAIDLTQHRELIVCQQTEEIEAFTGFETENHYAVLTEDGFEVLYAYEESGAISRQFMGSHRPLDIHVVDRQGEALLTASRPFFWFRSNLVVRDPNGAHVGELQRKFSLFGRRFLLTGDRGEAIGEIRGGMFRPNTFAVEDPAGKELGRVVKLWGGFMRESMSDADTFLVSFSDHARSNYVRLLILASAFAIDLDFFETSGQGAAIGQGGYHGARRF